MEKRPLSKTRVNPYSQHFIQAQVQGVFYNVARKRKPKVTQFDPTPVEWDSTQLMFHHKHGTLQLAVWCEGHLVIRSAWNLDPTVDAEFHLGRVMATGVAAWLEQFLKDRKIKHIISRGPLEESYLAEAVFEASLKGFR
jgi:hypothetical protein